LYVYNEVAGKPTMTYIFSIVRKSLVLTIT